MMTRLRTSGVKATQNIVGSEIRICFRATTETLGNSVCELDFGMRVLGVTLRDVNLNSSRSK